MTIFLGIILIIINYLTVYKYLFNIFFIDKKDFDESLRYTLTPDFISFFRGEYWKDRMGEMKLGIFIISCLIVTVIEYQMINKLIQIIF